jgi:hypothetical protein
MDSGSPETMTDVQGMRRAEMPTEMRNLCGVLGRVES